MRHGGFQLGQLVQEKELKKRSRKRAIVAGSPGFGAHHDALKQHQAQPHPDLSRVLSMGELTASIAHEIKQPLTAVVVTRRRACLEWLSADPPNLDKARHTVERIIHEGTRAGTVLSR